MKSVTTERQILRIFLCAIKKKQTFFNLKERRGYIYTFLEFLWSCKLIYGFIRTSSFHFSVVMKISVNNSSKIFPLLNPKLYGRLQKINALSNSNIKALFKFEKNLYFFFKKKENYFVHSGMKKRKIQSVSGYFIFCI